MLIKLYGLYDDDALKLYGHFCAHALSETMNFTMFTFIWLISTFYHVKTPPYLFGYLKVIIDKLIYASALSLDLTL